MAKKKAHSATPKLTEAEQELVSHMEHGYQLETDSLGSNLALRRLKDKDDEVVRPASANRNTVKALKGRSLISATKGHDPLTILWHIKARSKK